MDLVTSESVTTEVSTGCLSVNVRFGIGAAFSCAYRKTPGVCFILFGDGSLNTGAFAESMNLASLWKLPAVFLLENNGVAVSA